MLRSSAVQVYIEITRLDALIGRLLDPQQRPSGRLFDPEEPVQYGMIRFGKTSVKPARPRR